MISLDTLSTFGPELTPEELVNIDGGILPIVAVLLVTNAALKGTFIYLAVAG